MRATASKRQRSSVSGARLFAEPLEQRRLLAVILTSNTDGNLYRVNTATGAATLIGNMGAGIGQIASSPSGLTTTGPLYASDGDLYAVNPATGAATAIGAIGVSVNSLTVSPSGIIYGANTGLYSISTTTGAANFVGNLGGSFVSSGDLCFGTDGTLYLSSTTPGTSDDRLVKVNTATGAATLIGNIGFANVVGLALGQDGVMYGVTTGGQLLSINLATGAGSFIATISAGGMNDAASLVEPPAPPSTPPGASFTSATYTVNLNGTSAALTVQLTGSVAPTTDVDVFYNTVDDTAVAGVDYVAESGVIDFPAGALSEQVLIPILNSQSLAANKDFFVELTNPYTDQGSSNSNPPYVLVSPFIAQVTIQNVNSAFEISPNTVSANDSQGNATITVQRLGVISDQETVDFQTVYPSPSSIGTEAIPGINYDSVTTTLTFAPNQTTATVQIPLIATLSNIGQTENALLQLSNPQIIPPATGSPTAQNAFLLLSPNSNLPAGTGLLAISNVDASAPQITSLSLNHEGKKVTSITLQFSKPLAQASAQALSSYGIFKRDKDGPYATGPRTQIKLDSADYNAANDTVIVTPKGKLSTNKVYQFVAYGTDGVTDTAGHALAGNGTPATPGSNYSEFFGLGTKLNYIDADGDKVMLKLAGPGMLDLRRAFDGNASSLILDDTTPDSILSGKVKQGKYGDGLTTIDLVGNSSDINNELTNPPFIIIKLS